MIKITEYKGYTISYEEGTRLFVGVNGEETTGGKDTQEKVEQRIDVLTKVEFRRIPVMKDSHGKVVTGEITSVNFDDQSAWASFNGRREKLDLRGVWGDSVYQLTPSNEALVSEITTKSKAIQALDSEIKALRAKFEKKITLDYLRGQK